MNLKDVKQGWVCLWNEPRHAAVVAAGKGGHQERYQGAALQFDLCTSLLAIHLASSVGSLLSAGLNKEEVVLCDCIKKKKKFGKIYPFRMHEAFVKEN